MKQDIQAYLTKIENAIIKDDVVAKIAATSDLALYIRDKCKNGDESAIAVLQNTVQEYNFLRYKANIYDAVQLVVASDDVI